MLPFANNVNFLLANIRCLLRSYSAIFFIADARIGALFLAATFYFPNSGWVGLLAAMTGTLTARLFHFSNIKSGLYAYNSLLVGLALGAHFELSFSLLSLIILASILTVFITVTLADALWRFERLPALSLPFVIVAITITFASQGFNTLESYTPHTYLAAFPLPDLVNHFLIALGAAFFTPHPLAGLLLLLGILIASRYLAFLAVSGYGVGYFLYQSLSGISDNPLNYGDAFNFILTAMALGGIFMVPSVTSYLIALLGAALAVLVTMATQAFMQVYHLPVMAIPFLLTILTILSALSKRINSTPPYLLLEHPDLPEQSRERARLLAARGGKINSVPLYAPFQSTWTVYQGFNGKHTHQGAWQHALDFIITLDQKSYQHNGQQLTDYYCFGVPLFSPVYGIVVRCIHNLVDNPIGEVDVNNNWGNLILIRLNDGNYLLLCHLQQYSIQVVEGQTVIPAQLLANCGNSGRSPQPHLHMHVQKSAELGSATVPFHLTHVTTQGISNECIFRFYSRPIENELVSPLIADSGIKQALHLPIGKQLLYRFRKNDEEWQTRQLSVSVDLMGVFCLESNLGAKIYFVEDQHMLSFYARNRINDPFLTLFMLSLGVTPFAGRELSWVDKPPKNLIAKDFIAPLQTLSGTWQRASSLYSTYQRHWNEEQAVWQQQAYHTLGKKSTLSIKTIAFINPNIGCTQLFLYENKTQWLAELYTSGLSNDIGINEHLL